MTTEMSRDKVRWDGRNFKHSGDTKLRLVSFSVKLMVLGFFVLLPEGHGLFMHGLCFNAPALGGPPEGLGLNALASGPPACWAISWNFQYTMVLNTSHGDILCLILSAHDFLVFGTPSRGSWRWGLCPNWSFRCFVSIVFCWCLTLDCLLLPPLPSLTLSLLSWLSWLLPHVQSYLGLTVPPSPLYSSSSHVHNVVRSLFPTSCFFCFPRSANIC